MQRSWFLGDLLSQLFERPAKMRRASDARSLTELCEALRSSEGEVSGYHLAVSILGRYRELNESGKRAFFEYLNTELELDVEQLRDLAIEYATAPDNKLYKKLTAAAEPPRQELLRRLNQPAGATQSLVAMRTDLLRFLKQDPELRRTDTDFAHLLKSWFNRGFLVLKKINWNTAAVILDKIVAYEAVHQIDDLDALRRRLYPEDRRCFAFFHPAMPDEPLIFVEVALTEEVPGSIDKVLQDERDPIAVEDARVAVFYSISNCQKGLAGISFGNFLIKQVVAELATEFPALTTFVTLSPIPGLRSWAEQTVSSSQHDAAAEAAPSHATLTPAFGAHYILNAKRADGLPYDPVARFHLGNGAEVYDLHANADSSERGRAQSGGLMVNYLYDLNKTERNHEAFVTSQHVQASRSVHALAARAPTYGHKELPS